MSFGAPAAELGLASYYYGAAGLTAAHRSLPMGSRVKVLNLDNGRSVVLKIMDRGPFIHGRIIDVSTAAAEALGFRDAGLAHVKIDALAPEMRESGPRPEPRPILEAWWDESSRRFGLAETADDLAPLAARAGAFPTGADAAIRIPVSAIAEAEAASIPVGALPPVPDSKANPIRPAAGCGAAPSCETAKEPSASNFVVLLFARLRSIFD